MKLQAIILLILSIFSAVCAQDDFADEAETSALTQISLPVGTYNVRDQNIPAQYKQLLKQFVGDNPAFKQGRTELLVLTDGESGKPDFEKLRGEVEENFRNSGWNYEVHGQEKNVTFFTAIKKSPARINIFGYWVPEKKGLMLAMTEVLGAKSEPTIVDNPPISNQTPDQSVPSGSQTFNVSADELYVNVMGSKMPPMPSFPALPKKSGVVRGYVKDSSGKPLQGAYLGIRSTMTGGLYSGTSAETDAKGYYEIKLPMGAIHFYAGSYTIDYGNLRASMSLHPVNGSLKSFASADGAVENFVLLPYGITDRNVASESPNGATTYYGGAINVGYNLAELNNAYAPDNYIKENSEIEITLTPDGALLDGSTGGSFVIRKNVGNGLQFNIFNIPIGKYTITARLVNGNRPLLMKQSPRNKNTSGISPRESMGKASLTFEPDSAQNVMIKPAYGSWTSVSFNLYLK